MPGGWLGVDVFFVISGFLITGILLRDLEAGEFSLSRFYERRARRILPALTVVVLATMLVAPFFMWPWQLEELGKSVIATNAFIANVYFEARIDYFRPDAEIQPLIHMWSLAIEEQYYLFLPIVLAAMWYMGLRKKSLFAIMLALVVFGFSFTSLLAPYDPSATFYLIQYRAYELGVGSLAAVLSRSGWEIRGRWSRIATSLGILSIVLSVFVMDSGGGDPGVRIYALMGTALLLLSKVDDGIGSAILKHPATCFVGMISFSLYLWHQPVLAYSRLYAQSPSVMTTTALLGVVFVLSVLTWKFIEQPFRTRKVARSKVLAIAVISLIGISTLGAFMTYFLPQGISVAKVDEDLAVSASDRSDYLRSKYAKFKNKEFKNDGRKKVLIIGDSQSQDFVNILDQHGILQDLDVSTHYIRYRCQFYFAQTNMDHQIRSRDAKSCEGVGRRSPHSYLIDQADLIVVASLWEPWAATHIAETIKAMPSSFATKLVVIGPKHNRTHENIALHLPSYGGLPPATKAKINTKTPQKILRSDRLLKSALAQIDVPYISLLDLLCFDDGQLCPLFTQSGRLISYDGRHLTSEGAKWAASKLVRSSVFRSSMPKDGVDGATGNIGSSEIKAKQR